MAMASATSKASPRRLDHLVALGVDAVWISPIFPSPMRDFGYDVTDYCDIHPDFGTLADFDALLAGRPRARPQAHSRFRAQPHLRPASVVRRKPRLQGQPEAGLVRLARPEAGRLAAQQLGERIRRPGLDVRRGDRAVLLQRLSEGATGPQLAQSRRRARHGRCAALLVRARRRRLSGRRHPPSHRGRGGPRQSHQPGLAAGHERRASVWCKSGRSTSPACTTRSGGCAKSPTPIPTKS